MPVFTSTELAPPDPILGLTTAWKKDPRHDKVNLGVGAYRTAEGNPYVLKSVRDAERILLNSNSNKEYLPISGDPQFIQAAMQLHFANDCTWIQEGCYFAAQTIGGTGSLHLAGRLLKFAGINKIALSTPSWPNHTGIFSHAGLELLSYPYYDASKKGIDFTGLCEGIGKLPAGTAVLLHACCHNPTGCDLSTEQWKEISELLLEKGLIPLIDMAYQGFGDGLDEDAAAVRALAEDHKELILCSSFSKNIGLYGERLGLLCIRTPSQDNAARIGSQVKVLIRGMYSNPPLHGAQIVSTILNIPELRTIWEEELCTMRSRIQEMRASLVSGLLAKGGHRDFNYLKQQRGMFSFTGLSAEQVQRLTQVYGIYMPSSGRVNVAGLTSDTLDYVVDAFLSVMD